VVGSDFEAVDVSSLMIDPNSGQAKQTTVSVTVSPATASLLQGQTQQFSAIVQNSSSSVTWWVNGVLGGSAAAGFIDSTGFYTAPPSVTSTLTVTVTATTAATPTVSGSATVTITAPVKVTVTVSPASATVRPHRTRQFSATVSGSSNQAVIWKVSGVTGGNNTVGTISAGGLYTAPAVQPSPATVTVTAVSAADSTASGSASVTIPKK
jgi:hypothetical protein